MLDGDPVPDSVVFKNTGDEPDRRGMSTDWCRYSTPQKTRRRAEARPASHYGVVSLSVEQIREIDRQRDEHTPTFVGPQHPLNNRSHTDVFGPKGADETGDPAIATEIRNRFQEISVWEIRPDDPVDEVED